MSLAQRETRKRRRQFTERMLGLVREYGADAVAAGLIRNRLLRWLERPKLLPRDPRWVEWAALRRAVAERHLG